MKQISRMLGLALVFAVSLLVTNVLTQAQEPKKDPPAQTQTQTVTIKGTVANVSETSVTIVDSNKAEQVIAIDSNTKITKAGKAATAADIKANDTVEVTASKGEGDALTAVAIKVA